ncbi:MAG: AI-2E family transporter [Schleiferiaceae bacterium]
MNNSSPTIQFLRIGALALILYWSFTIIQPFVSIVIWAGVISITLYPVHLRLTAMFKGRKRWSATLITVVALTVLTIPTYFFGESLVEATSHLVDMKNSDQLQFPPPEPEVKEWPLIGKKVHEMWTQASSNLYEMIPQYEGPIRRLIRWIFDALAGFGAVFLQLFVSTIIAGIFLTVSEPAEKFIEKFINALSPNFGDSVTKLSAATVRSVAKGIIGISFIQALLAGVGMAIGGIPLVGLWTALALVLSIMQIGTLPVAIIVAIISFKTMDTTPAVIMTIYMLVVGVLDNILKPILLGKGVNVPMLVVFIGAIGGFMSSGFMGLFLGPIILSIAYKLTINWVELQPKRK